MGEEKWIPCYETDAYEVSSDGLIRNAKTGRILKTQIDDHGRERVTIQVNGMKQTRMVHRLVAEAFYNIGLGEANAYHRDGNKLNNRIDNIEIGDRSDAIKNACANGCFHSTRRKKLMVVETGKIYNSIRECSEDTGINPSTISKCLNYDFYGNRQGLHFVAVD